MIVNTFPKIILNVKQLTLPKHTENNLIDDNTFPSIQFQGFSPLKDVIDLKHPMTL